MCPLFPLSPALFRPLSFFWSLAVTHANRALGLPDEIFAMGDDLVLTVLGQIGFMPVLVLAGPVRECLYVYVCVSVCMSMCAHVSTYLSLMSLSHVSLSCLSLMSPPISLSCLSLMSLSHVSLSCLHLSLSVSVIASTSVSASMSVSVSVSTCVCGCGVCV